MMQELRGGGEPECGSIGGLVSLENSHEEEGRVSDVQGGVIAPNTPVDTREISVGRTKGVLTKGQELGDCENRLSRYVFKECKKRRRRGQKIGRRTQRRRNRQIS